jgi:hypothetical protein
LRCVREWVVREWVVREWVVREWVVREWVVRESMRDEGGEIQRTSHDFVYRLLPSMSMVPSTSLTILAPSN